MKVLFSNPPWWAETTKAMTPEGVAVDLYRMGVRAGSRWPFTLQTCLPPDRYESGMAGQLYLPYPFFLGYAATYAARQTSAEVRFRDSIALHESYDAYFRYLEEQRFELIVIESASPSWDHDRTLIHTLAERFPGTRFVVTGPIASAAASILAECPEVVAVVKGEYEKGLVKVINGARGIVDFDLLTLEEMNAAPFPWFDDLHALRYCDTNPRGQRLPHAHVWSSRGCPFKCIFCVWPATMTGNDPDGKGKRTVRHYSPEYMEAYLTEIVEKYKFQSIYFDDDTFNLGDRHVENMCRVMRRIGIPWSAMCRSDSSRMDLWKEMRDSGCFGVKLGFESGNQWVVDNIVNKRLDLEHAREVVRHLRELGMTVHGTFTFGLPGETPEQMRDTEQYIQSLGLNSLQKSGCADIEGTPLHTLSEGGALSGYDGASIDGNYVREQDGARKLEKLQSKPATDGKNAAGAGMPRPSAGCAHGGPAGEMKAVRLDAAGPRGVRALSPSPEAAFQIKDRDRAEYREVESAVPGYSGLQHYAFFRTLVVEYGVRSILMLGVYLGRDISLLLQISKVYGIPLHIVGVDKFTNDSCLDWPDEKRAQTWQEAGYGNPPDLEAASRHLQRFGLGASNVRLVKGPDEAFLAGTPSPFDLVFLDTSHDTATVKRQIEGSLRFLHPKGFLAGDCFRDDGSWGVATAINSEFAKFWRVGDSGWFVAPGAEGDTEPLSQHASRVRRREITENVFLYMDPGLQSNLGHHANSCRSIAGELRLRRIPTPILCNLGINAELRDELGATPWFRFFPYAKYSDDAICGWIHNHEKMAQGTVEDLQRLREVTAFDVVFMNSVLPPQFRALILWARSLSPAERPQIIMEFGTEPGLDVIAWRDGKPRFQVRDPRIDSRATFYRHTAELLTPEDQAFIHLATFDSQSSEIYQQLLKGYPVSTLPLPQRAVTDRHSRVGKRPITLGILGHQRGEKGFPLVPEIVRTLLKTDLPIRFLVHNGMPDGLVEPQEELRKMAVADSRLTLNESPADATLWARLLDDSDLIVCPYMPDRFMASYSAVASEAIANAIPLVVPARTTLARVVEEFGGPGITFDGYSAQAVCEAVTRAVRNFDELAANVDRASETWNATRGAPCLVDALLEIRNRSM